MISDGVSIKFVIGSRQLFVVRRQLRTVSCGLESLIAGTSPDFGVEDAGLEGYRVLSVSESARDDMLRAFPHHVVGGLRRYRRHYINMAGTFADYFARFSGKTRSTLNRKRRKLAERSGGKLDLEEFRQPAEIDRFFADAIPLSRRTYQARLLDAGLPEGDAARKAALELSARDGLRAFLLRIDGHAIAYLYLPLEGATLRYAFLGYDPDYVQYSPGTVLQLEALERLFAEQRYRYFDFTEGEGAHKALFGTDSVAACDFFLLRARLSNRLLLRSLDLFNGTVANLKNVAAHIGVLAHARRVLRS